MTTPSTILLRAAEIVDRGWTQGEFARDRDGNRVEDSHPEACQFCADGAIHLACDLLGLGMDDKLAARELLASHLGLNDRNEPIRIWEWNDAEGRTAPEVSAALRAAAGRMT